MDPKEIERKNKSRFRIFMVIAFLNIALIGYLAYQIYLMFSNI